MSDQTSTSKTNVLVSMFENTKGDPKNGSMKPPPSRVRRPARSDQENQNPSSNLRVVASPLRDKGNKKLDSSLSPHMRRTGKFSPTGLFGRASSTAIPSSGKVLSPNRKWVSPRNGNVGHLSSPKKISPTHKISPKGRVSHAASPFSRRSIRRAPKASPKANSKGNALNRSKDSKDGKDSQDSGAEGPTQTSLQVQVAPPARHPPPRPSLTPRTSLESKGPPPRPKPSSVLKNYLPSCATNSASTVPASASGSSSRPPSCKDNSSSSSSSSSCEQPTPASVDSDTPIVTISAAGSSDCTVFSPTFSAAAVSSPKQSSSNSNLSFKPFLPQPPPSSTEVVANNAGSTPKATSAASMFVFPPPSSSSMPPLDSGPLTVVGEVCSAPHEQASPSESFSFSSSVPSSPSPALPSNKLLDAPRVSGTMGTIKFWVSPSKALATRAAPPSRPQVTARRKSSPDSLDLLCVQQTQLQQPQQQQQPSREPPPRPRRRPNQATRRTGSVDQGVAPGPTLAIRTSSNGTAEALNTQLASTEVSLDGSPTAATKGELAQSKQIFWTSGSIDEPHGDAETSESDIDEEEGEHLSIFPDELVKESPSLNIHQSESWSHHSHLRSNTLDLTCEEGENSDAFKKSGRRKSKQFSWYAKYDFHSSVAQATARDEIVRRFKEGEVAFQADLQMAQRLLTEVKGIVPDTLMTKLFGRTDAVLDAHNKFLTAIQTHEDVVTAFLGQPIFHIILELAMQGDQERLGVLKAIAADSSLAARVEEALCSLEPDPTKRKDLNFYTSLANGRLTLYLDFIRALRNLTPENHLAFASVKFVESEISELMLSKAMDELRRAQNISKLSDFRKRMIGLPFDICTPSTRLFLRESILKKVRRTGLVRSNHQRRFILFSDVLLWTSMSWGYSGHIYLRTATVESTPDTTGTYPGRSGLANMLAVSGKSRSVSIIFPDEAEKDAWREDILRYAGAGRLLGVASSASLPVAEQPNASIDADSGELDQTSEQKVKPDAQTQSASPPKPPELGKAASLDSSAATPSSVARKIEPSVASDNIARTKKDRIERSEKASGISRPFNFQHKIKVDQSMRWESSNMESNFELVQKLGEGSFGAVWRAKHRTAGFELAVKLITSPPGDAEGGAEMLKEIKDEIQILKECKDDNIVSYYGSFGPDSKGRLWIMMDLCEVGSMNDLQQRTRVQLSERQVAYIAKCTLKALAYLHKRRIWHRDIKGSNILLNRHGGVQLADFGVSVQQTVTDTVRDGTVSFCGTPLWVAPEVLCGKPGSAAADLWSFGITVIEVAEGFPPRHNLRDLFSILRAVVQDPAPGLTYPTLWSSKLKSFLKAVLVKDHLKRPSAEQLLNHDFIRSAPASPACLMPVLKRFFYVQKRQEPIPGSWDFLRNSPEVILPQGVKNMLTMNQQKPATQVPKRRVNVNVSIPSTPERDGELTAIQSDDSMFLADGFLANGFTQSAPEPADGDEDFFDPPQEDMFVDDTALPDAIQPSVYDHEHPQKFAQMNEAGVGEWLAKNQFSEESRRVLKDYCGSDLLACQRQDFLDLVGTRDGIRLHVRVQKAADLPCALCTDPEP
eukprot:g31859.t1